MAFTWKNVFALRKSPKDQILQPRRGFALSGGVRVDEDSAMEVSAYHRGVIYISTQIAKLPWAIKDSDNKIQDGSTSKLAVLLDLAPNPEMNSFMFRLLGTQVAINRGNFFAEIERNGSGQAVALWPLNNKYVELLRTPEGNLIYRILGGSASHTGQDVYIPYNDMFHLRNFHTKDGITGQGLIPYAMNTLGISLGADQMANSLFANGGLPSGVLEVKGALSDEAYKRIKDSWKENYSGRRAGGVALLEDEMKFTPVSMSPDVLQFLESRKFSVLEIARFLGLPPTKLFDTEAATFNNQENSNLEVATDTLDAWAKNWEMEADLKILNRRYGGRRSEMDLYAVFRGDMETRANYFSKMMQTASITPNEIRRREGLAPYKDGDRWYVAVNNYSPADRIDEIVDAQIKQKDQPKQQDSHKADPKTKAEAELAIAAIDFLKRK